MRKQKRTVKKTARMTAMLCRRQCALPLPLKSFSCEIVGRECRATQGWQSQTVDRVSEHTSRRVYEQGTLPSYGFAFTLMASGFGGTTNGKEDRGVERPAIWVNALIAAVWLPNGKCFGQFICESDRAAKQGKGVEE